METHNQIETRWIAARLAALGIGLLLGAAWVPPAFGAKATFQRSKPHANIGTIGHTELGRDLLVTALAQSIERPLFWRQEQWKDTGGTGSLQVGVLYSKIRTYFPQWHIHQLPDLGIDRALITGAVDLDGAILVVSAAEGVFPQTREHILLARQVGVSGLVVFNDDVDGATSPADLELLKLAILDLLDLNGYDTANTPIIPGSTEAALRGDASARAALVELVEAIDLSIPQPVSKADKPFLMPIEDVFSIDRGAARVAGPIESGRVKTGDELEIVGILPGVKRAVVRTILVIAEDIEGEDYAELILDGVEAGELRAGQVVAEPGLLQPALRLQALVYVLEEKEGGKPKPFFTNYRPQFYFRTMAVEGAMDLLSTDSLPPGEAGLIDVAVDIPTALNAGTRFVIRDGGNTVGAGVVVGILETDLHPEFN